MKYILYCRKSSESEDRQVMSIDAQEREMIAIATREGFSIVKTLKESQSAKDVGRPIFNEMISLLKTRKADGILTWKLDRLARNFIDGGIIIDMLQKGAIQQIKTHDRLCLPSDNVLMLAVEFGMANQYVRDLSVNVKRGNREKLSRGEWPNHAPFGYLNDKTTKTIVVDPVLSKYVVRAFELYLTGSHSFQSISDTLYQEGLRTQTGKKVFKGHIQKIISSVFYMGIMERDKKYYDGKHQPLVSKETFEKAQDIKNNNSRPRSQHLFFPLRGFLKCETCGCALTASLKKGHHYYYCTNGKQKCEEHKNYLRENYLYDTVAELLNSLDFTERKIEIMYQSAKERTAFDTGYITKALDTLQSQIDTLKTKEMRLLDTFLAGQITQELYDQKNIELQNERVSTTKQIKELQTKQPAFTLEPIKEIFLQASRAKKEFIDADDFKKREIVEKLLWNLFMENKKVASISFKSPFDIMFRAPKNGDFSTLLRDLDSNQDKRYQKPLSYH